MPARELSMPSYVPHAPDKPITGVIMSVDGGVSELGQYQIVTINRGSRDGIEVGHVLASFRTGAPISGRRAGETNFDWSRPSSWFTWNTVQKQAADPAPNTAPPSGALVLPDERNGLLFVFRVFEKMSYAMVMKASRPIYIGDKVQTP
jgi:hypothetical protein